MSTVSEGGGGTASFNIERAVSIDADAKPHKVTIVMLNCYTGYIGYTYN